MVQLGSYVRQVRTQTVWLTATLPPAFEEAFIRRNLLRGRAWFERLRIARTSGTACGVIGILTSLFKVNWMWKRLFIGTVSRHPIRDRSFLQVVQRQARQAVQQAGEDHMIQTCYRPLKTTVSDLASSSTNYDA